MNRKIRVLASSAIVSVIVAGVILVSLPAFAVNPPWEPDANSAAPYGGIVLYDSNGNVLTGGSNLNHLADYAAATSRPNTCTTKATLSFARPDHAQADTTLWTTGSGSASTTFPNAAAPAPITGPAFTSPLVTLGPTDADLGSFITSILPDTTTGYANRYQLRMKDTGPVGCTGSSPKYWSLDVEVTGSNWQVIYPAVATTTTAITTVPANGGNGGSGSSVSLSATVTPASNGTIQFYDGTTAVGSGHAVTTGTPTATDSDTPADGSHTYTATFTPTGGTLVQGSTSSGSTVTIGGAPPAPTANNVDSPTPQALTVDNLSSNTITITYGSANDSASNPETITGNSTVVTQPTHGTVQSVTAGQFMYTNTDGTATSDSFVVAGATVTCSPTQCSNEPLTGNQVTVNVTINAAAPPPSIDGAIVAKSGNIRAAGTRARLTAIVTNVGTVNFTVCDTDIGWVASTGSVGPALHPGCTTLTPGGSKRFAFYFTYSGLTPGDEVTLTADLTVTSDADTSNNTSTTTETVR